ncbi:MAG: hypothetical protein AUG44_14735 [Actinobacteria bacterium 13_1_20CM_3_71_11]|nr:MAG: hypothetical protein AUG44_14735 [Actinobacteria bacterium 13_1_20CM_3_71_11]
MTDLTARLLAVIEETERIAQGAGGGSWRVDSINEGAVVSQVDSLELEGDVAAYIDATIEYGDPVGTPLRTPIAVHVARHDPAAVLRRCAADRKILAAHEHETALIAFGGSSFGCVVCSPDYGPGVQPLGWCDTIKALAEGYGLEVGE